MLLVPGSAILISPQARCVWDSAVRDMLEHLGCEPTALGPMVAEILADGTAVLYRVGPGGVTLSLQLPEEDWRPRWLL